MADTLDIKHEFERWMSQRGESAVYIGDGLYSSGDVSDQAEAFAAGVELVRAALASRSAEVDDKHQQDLRDVLNLTWSAAVESAAFYVAGHCHDGDFHAETILELVKPKIRVRGVEILPSPAPSHTTNKENGT